MNSIVRLTTTGMQNPVSITDFQFGTVPARQDSYRLTAHSVPAGSENLEVFWFERNEVPANQFVRFNLRFELNVHNSADLQIHLGPGAKAQWRWAAPIGFVGTWSSAEQQAPWSDADTDFCININGSEDTIDVSLSEHAATDGPLCAVIPAEQNVGEMVRQR
jgi:hypothetical protein